MSNDRPDFWKRTPLARYLPRDGASRVLTSPQLHSRCSGPSYSIEGEGDSAAGILCH